MSFPILSSVPLFTPHPSSGLLSVDFPPSDYILSELFNFQTATAHVNFDSYSDLSCQDFFWACESVFKITDRNWAVVIRGDFTLKRGLLFPKVADIPKSWASALIPQNKCFQVCNEPTSRSSQNTVFSITVEFSLWIEWNAISNWDIWIMQIYRKEKKNKMVWPGQERLLTWEKLTFKLELWKMHYNQVQL